MMYIKTDEEMTSQRKKMRKIIILMKTSLSVIMIYVQET